MYTSIKTSECLLKNGENVWKYIKIKKKRVSLFCADASYLFGFFLVMHCVQNAVWICIYKSRLHKMEL